MLHAKKIAIATAYDIYRECAEGNIDKDWKHVAVDFYRFREKLAKQMLFYDPRNRRYPGDDKLRTATQQHKSRRPPGNGSVMPSNARSPFTPARSVASCASSSTSGVSAQDIKNAGSRLCGDFTDLMAHYKAMTKFPGSNSRVCAVCGQRSTYYCSLCKATVHHPSVLREDIKGPCFIQWHNTMFLGLARDDYKLVGIVQKNFQQPTLERQEEHALAMKAMLTHHAHHCTPSTPLPQSATRRKRNRADSDSTVAIQTSDVDDESDMESDGIHAFRFKI
jgi:hypothetical protein